MNVSEMTVEELRELVRETVDDVIAGYFGEDPEGRIRPEWRQRLLESMKNPGPTKTIEEVAQELGIDLPGDVRRRRAG